MSALEGHGAEPWPYEYDRDTSQYHKNDHSDLHIQSRVHLAITSAHGYVQGTVNTFVVAIIYRKAANLEIYTTYTEGIISVFKLSELSINCNVNLASKYK